MILWRLKILIPEDFLKAYIGEDLHIWQHVDLLEYLLFSVSLIERFSRYDLAL